MLTARRTSEVGAVEHAVVAPKRRQAVDVNGSPDLRRDAGRRHVLGVKLRPPVLEIMHCYGSPIQTASAGSDGTLHSPSSVKALTR